MPPFAGDLPPRSVIGSVAFDPLTRMQAATHVRDCLARGEGGRLVIVSQDQLRHVDERPRLRRMLADASLVLAGSATAVLASRLAGTPLPERITAPAMAEALFAGCLADGRRIYLIGGAPGGSALPAGAQRAAAILGLRHPGLRVAGCASPSSGDRAALAAVVADAVEAKPDLVLISVESDPFEESLVAAVRAELVSAWFFGGRSLIDNLVGDGTHRSRRGTVSYSARLLARAAAARMSRH